MHYYRQLYSTEKSMGDLEADIEEDKQKHPNCGYSKQFSKEVLTIRCSDN